MGYAGLSLGVLLVSALLTLGWPWRSGGSGSPFLRLLGALLGMGLALLGAGLLVTGQSPPLALALALLGPGLALLAALGGDRLWMGRFPIAGGVLVSAGLGFAGALALGLPAALGPLLLAATFGAQVGWLGRDPEVRARLQALSVRLEPWMVLLALAVLVRIPVPLWPQGFPLLGLTQMVLLTLAALEWGWRRIGPRILLLAATAFGLGLGLEVMGSQTGFPFGSYSYAGAPPPLLWGVPLVVPLGWFALVFSAHLLANGRPWYTGLLVLAWDAGLEALMTTKGYWAWHDPHPLWYGAPLSNYLAWFGVGSLFSLLFSWLAPGLGQGGMAWAYRLEALFLPAGLLLFGLWPAAVVCALGMNLLAWPWKRRVRRGPQMAT